MPRNRKRPTGLAYILDMTFAQSDACRAEQDACGIIRHCFVCGRPETSGAYNLCAEHDSEQKTLQRRLLRRSR